MAKKMKIEEAKETADYIFERALPEITEVFDDVMREFHAGIKDTEKAEKEFDDFYDLVLEMIHKKVEMRKW